MKSFQDYDFLWQSFSIEWQGFGWRFLVCHYFVFVGFGEKPKVNGMTHIAAVLLYVFSLAVTSNFLDAEADTSLKWLVQLNNKTKGLVSLVSSPSPNLKVGTNLAFWTWHCDWGWGSWWKQKEVSGFKQNAAWFFPSTICLLCFMPVCSSKITEKHPPFPHIGHMYFYMFFDSFLCVFCGPF